MKGPGKNVRCRNCKWKGRRTPSSIDIMNLTDKDTDINKTAIQLIKENNNVLNKSALRCPKCYKVEVYYISYVLDKNSLLKTK